MRHNIWPTFSSIIEIGVRCACGCLPLLVSVYATEMTDRHRVLLEVASVLHEIMVCY